MGNESGKQDLLFEKYGFPKDKMLSRGCHISTTLEGVSCPVAKAKTAQLIKDNPETARFK